MHSKTMIWIFLLAGAVLGSLVPSLWGESMTSLESLGLCIVGGIAGVLVGYKMSR
ncbi:MAG: hypothetical protein KA052_01270 [Candidatus Pacebacteria bacterium]|nr:hypothetical protein [Candidatus Paceibacterota bacterium]